MKILEALKSFILEQDLFVQVSLVCFSLALIIQFYYYLFYFRKAIQKKSLVNTEAGISNEPVSIIICARNEAENLKKNLPVILEQNYKNFEVVVVDDRSEDETEEILNSLTLKYPHLRVSRIKSDPKFTHGKKLALMLGIKASLNEWLLLTDADCHPESKNWLSQMQKNFNQGTDIVLGYSGYFKEPGLLNLLIRFDTVFTALMYFGMARAGKPYMGVGRNLAYRKSLFFKNNGFATHSGLKSGDDDLFVNESANSNNTAVEMHSDSFTWSIAEKKFINWYWQKRRHLTTGSRYKTASKFRLIIENLSRILLLISFILLLIKSTFAIYILIAFIALYLLKAIVFKILFTRLKEKFLFLPSLLIEPLFPFFFSYLHFRNFFERNRTKWK